MTAAGGPLLAGIVLAAGASTRMGAGRNKLLETVAGRPVVLAPIAALRDAGVGRIVVVTGHAAEAVEAEVAGPGVEVVRHADWTAGMGASIACGARALAGSVPPLDGVLVCPGDLPRLTVRPVAALVAAFAGLFEGEGEATARAAICVPECRGRVGHPVLFGAAHLDALGRLTGDRGARALVDAAGAARRRIDVDDDGIHRDVDTPAALDAVRRGS